MKKLLGILVASMAVAAAPLTVRALHAEGDQTITHTYGGEDGEWETDLNTEGIWNYYAVRDCDPAKADAVVVGEDEYTLAAASGDSYFQISSSGFMHPGEAPNFSSPTVAYVVEEDGAINISFEATRETVAANPNSVAYNNGTKAHFYVNTTNKVGEVNVVETTNTGSFEHINVKKGDQVFMIVHSKNNTSYDGATYKFTVTLEVGQTYEESSSEEGGDSGVSHTFGGTEGEWETDDNTEGIWSYYACVDALPKNAVTPTLAANQSEYSHSDAYFKIGNDGFLHPGDKPGYSSPAVAYIAEEDGSINIDLVAYRDAAAETPDDLSWDGGTLAHFYVNDAEYGNVRVIDTENTYSIEHISVTKGDKVFLIADANGSTRCDGATYVFTVTLEAGKTYDEPAQPLESSSEPEGGDDPIESSEEVISSSEEESSSYTPVHPADPELPALEGDLTTFDNIKDYRYYQGAKGFTYMYSKVSEGIEGLLPLVASNNMWDTAGQVEWLGIRSDGLMHPGSTDQDQYGVAIGWTSDAARVVDIHFDACFEDLDTNYGNGVNISIFKNTEELLSFDLIPDDNIYNDRNPIVAEIHRLELEANDTIYVYLHGNGDTGWDGTLTFFEISYVKETVVESSSQAADSTPAGTSETTTSSEETPITPEDVTKGCGGSIVATGLISLVALAGVVLVKSKKEEK